MKVSQKKSAFIIASFVVVQLIFLLFIKYSNQSLSLRDFSLANLGNIFNLVISVILISGIVTALKREKVTIKPLIIFTIITSLTLCLAFLSTLVRFPGSSFYIVGQPGDKVFDAFLFTIYEFLLFTFISYVWLKVFNSNKHVVLRSLANGVFLLMLFLLVTFIFIQTKGYNSACWKLSKNKKNIIVVLGAAVWSDNKPSPSLSSRVDEAIKLYNDGYGGKIILTGSNAPGEMSEAEVAYNYAKSRGMDMNNVEYETITTSTIEQVNFIKRNLLQRSDIADIIVVSDSYHLMRVLEVSEFFKTRIKVAAAKTSMDFQENLYRQLRESIALNVFWSFAL